MSFTRPIFHHLRARNLLYGPGFASRPGTLPQEGPRTGDQHHPKVPEAATRAPQRGALPAKAGSAVADSLNLSTFWCPALSPSPFDPVPFLSCPTRSSFWEMGEASEPQGGSRITCASVTPSHVGEQKADPQPTVSTEGSKPQLCPPGQSRKESPPGPDSATVGTLSAQKLSSLLTASIWLLQASHCVPFPAPCTAQTLPTQPQAQDHTPLQQDPVREQKTD